MAYARFRAEGSDVYVYHDVGGFLICVRCGLSDERETRTTSRKAMVEHLKSHLTAGESVPQSAFDELEREILELGDDLR
jgi:hypothetical protein